jgi:hypothetical protein
MRAAKESTACKHSLVLVPAYLGDMKLDHSGNEGEQEQVLHKELE